jgi:hypothetical protein
MYAYLDEEHFKELDKEILQNDELRVILSGTTLKDSSDKPPKLPGETFGSAFRAIQITYALADGINQDLDDLNL